MPAVTCLLINGKKHRSAFSDPLPTAKKLAVAHPSPYIFFFIFPIPPLPILQTNSIKYLLHSSKIQIPQQNNQDGFLHNLNPVNLNDPIPLPHSQALPLHKLHPSRRCLKLHFPYSLPPSPPFSLRPLSHLPPHPHHRCCRLRLRHGCCFLHSMVRCPHGVHSFDSNIPRIGSDACVHKNRGFSVGVEILC